LTHLIAFGTLIIESTAESPEFRIAFVCDRDFASCSYVFPLVSPLSSLLLMWLRVDRYLSCYQLLGVGFGGGAMNKSED
jgi:hypothetical protein